MKPKPLNLLLLSLLSMLFLVSCSHQTDYTDKSHYSEGKFRNVHQYDPPGFSDFIKWRWENLWKDIPGVDSYQFPLDGENSKFLSTSSKDTNEEGILTALLDTEFGNSNREKISGD
jgi:hypothetical protein